MQSIINLKKTPMSNEDQEIPNNGKGEIMEPTIINSIRLALGLSANGSEFADEIFMHVNSALLILNQNGIGRKIQLTMDSTWEDFKDPTQTEGNEYFEFVPTFVMTKTKILFDPPPPSNAPYYDGYIKETLWRLKVAYEEPII